VRTPATIERELAAEFQRTASPGLRRLGLEYEEALRGKATDPATRPGFAGSPLDDKNADGLWKLQKATRKFGGWAPTYRPPEGANVTPETEHAHREAWIKGLDKLTGLPDGDPWADFSMLKLLLAQTMAPRVGWEAALKKYAPLESRWLEAVQKAQGEYVSGQDGGFLSPEVWDQRFQEMIYAAQVTSRLPLTRVSMTGRVEHVPKMTGQMTVAYSAENAALTATQAQLAQVSFTARKQYTYVLLSNELIRDSSPDAEMVFRNHMSTLMGVDKDFQILLGNGLAGTPVGLFNQTNVVRANMAAGSLAYTDLTNGIFLVEDLNGSTNVPVGQTTCTGIVSAVNIVKQLQNMVDSSGRPLADYGWQRGEFRRPQDTTATSGFLAQLFGVDTWLRTNIVKKSINSSGASVPTGTGTVNPIFFGDWKHLWVKERQDIEFMASQVAGAAFANDQTAVRAIARYDVAAMHPEAFFVLNNVPAS